MLAWRTKNLEISGSMERMGYHRFAELLKEWVLKKLTGGDMQITTLHYY